MRRKAQVCNPIGAWRQFADTGGQLPGTSGDAMAQTWCSLITVSYNNSATLERFWSSVRPQGVEWIVVDNASTDDSVAVAERLGAKVIRLPSNSGFSNANNAGLAHASADFIGFVNPDIAVEYEDLDALRETAEQSGAVVAPQLLNADGTLQPNGRGYPLLTAKIRNRLRGGDPRYLLFASDDEPRPVCWVMGAAVFATRNVLERFGAWDPHFFLYYEDKDICLRAWKCGTPVLLVPTTRWVHGWARETTGFRLGPWRREFASMAKFYRRYPEFLLGHRASRRAHPAIEAAVFASN